MASCYYTKPKLRVFFNRASLTFNASGVRAGFMVWRVGQSGTDFLFDVSVGRRVFQLVNFKAGIWSSASPTPSATAVPGTVQAVILAAVLRQPLSLTELGSPVLEPDLCD